MVTVLCSLLGQVPSCHLVALLETILVHLTLLLHGEKGKEREGVEGLYILYIQVPHECITEKIVRGCCQEANKARGKAKCLIRSRDHIRVQSFP